VDVFHILRIFYASIYALVKPDLRMFDALLVKKCGPCSPIKGG
jgi:hypothetical protein